MFQPIGPRLHLLPTYPRSSSGKPCFVASHHEPIVYVFAEGLLYSMNMHLNTTDVHERHMGDYRSAYLGCVDGSVYIKKIIPDRNTDVFLFYKGQLFPNWPAVHDFHTVYGTRYTCVTQRYEGYYEDINGSVYPFTFGGLTVFYWDGWHYLQHRQWDPSLHATQPSWICSSGDSFIIAFKNGSENVTIYRSHGEWLDLLWSRSSNEPTTVTYSSLDNSIYGLSFDEKNRDITLLRYCPQVPSPIETLPLTFVPGTETCGHLTLLYRRSPDLFYYVLSYLEPTDLWNVARTHRQCYNLIAQSQYRNLWMEWWKHNVSEVSIPRSLLRNCLWFQKRQLSSMDYVRLGYEKALMSRLNFSDVGPADYLTETIKTCQYHITEIVLRYTSPIDEHMILTTSRGDVKMLDLLHRYGGDLNCANGTVLYNAAQYGHLEMVMYLLNEGCSILNMGRPPLEAAVLGGHLPIVKFLFEAGADIRANNDQAMRGACFYGQIEIVRYLHEHGAPITQDLLIIPRWGSKYEVMEYLLAQGLDIQHNDNALLVQAVQGRSPTTVKFLVDHGADPRCRNGEPVKTAIVRQELSKVKHLMYPETNLDELIALAQEHDAQEIVEYLMALKSETVPSKY